MKTRRSRYYGHRFPAEIISHAVWLYHRFCLSFRDVEDLLAERCIVVTYETIRHWCQKVGPDYVRRLKRRQGRLGDTWHLDELFLKINGKLHYLWRAVDQDGDVIDILVQSRRDQHAAGKPGVDPKVASDQRGHGIGVSLEVYTSSDIDEKRAAVKKLEAAVLRGHQPKDHLALGNRA